MAKFSRGRPCFSSRCVLPCENQTKSTNFAAFFIVPYFQKSLGYELCRRCIANELKLWQVLRQPEYSPCCASSSICLQQLLQQLALVPPSSKERFTGEWGAFLKPVQTPWAKGDDNLCESPVKLYEVKTAGVGACASIASLIIHPCPMSK